MQQDILANVADNTPIIVGAGQYSEQISGDEAPPPLSSPMDLAANAARQALADAGGALNGRDIDTIAMIRLFSDSAPAWACPFGGSNNPPESIALRIGAQPARRIYSNAGGSQPLQLLAELFTDIARGKTRCALLAGTEAIASQRHAQRNQLTLDWQEEFELPLDSREYTERFATPEEQASGMFLPVHYYALIENLRAARQGNSPEQHRQQMAKLLAPFSSVAADNPYAFFPVAHTPEALCSEAGGNYPISLPYSKLLVAQDAVNQAAALVLTSAGQARAWGIDPRQWIFLQGYAEGSDQCLSEREDPSRSEAMRKVFHTALASAQASASDMELVDIYSCFPCAVESACDELGYAIDGSRALTVTGGLPYFGGPGNNYSMHALAEMSTRLRGSASRGLVTANGGILSKHAAAVLGNTPAGEDALPLDLASDGPAIIDRDSIPVRAFCDAPTAGVIISYTVLFQRGADDLGIVLGETGAGERFLAHSAAPELVAALKADSPVGRQIALTREEQRLRFEFAC